MLFFLILVFSFLFKKETRRTMVLADDRNIPEDEYVMRMNDSGMIDAAILPSDYLMVHIQDDVDIGDIAVAVHDENTIVRRLGIKDGGIYLIPENDSYICIKKSDVTIIG